METEIVENISDTPIVKVTLEDENESDSEFEFEKTEEQNTFFLKKYGCE